MIINMINIILVNLKDLFNAIICLYFVEELHYYVLISVHLCYNSSTRCNSIFIFVVNQYL